MGDYTELIVIAAIALLLVTWQTPWILNDTQKAQAGKVFFDAISSHYVIKGSEQYYEQFPDENPANRTPAPTPVETVAPSSSVSTASIDLYREYRSESDNRTLTQLIRGASGSYDVRQIDPTSPLLNIGDEYSWNRTDVDGLKDMHGHVSVYRVIGMDTFHWHSYAWGKDFEEPAPEGYQWLFVFIRIYLDYDGTEGSSNLWIPDQRHFAISTGSHTYYPDTTTLNPVNYVREFSDNNIRSVDNTTLAKPYDYSIYYRPNYDELAKDGCGTYTVNNITYFYTCEHEGSEGGYIANITGVLFPGKSNAEDGYILFKVPRDWATQDTKVISNIYAFGTPAWEIGNPEAATKAEMVATNVRGYVASKDTAFSNMTVRGMV